MKKLNEHQLKALQISQNADVATFIYPTGTGKTLIEARIIGDSIKRSAGSVFVVLAPRIMLAQQLFSEIWSDLVQNGNTDCLFFGLHSGSKQSLLDEAKKLYLKSDRRKKHGDHTELEVDDQDDDMDLRAVRELLKEDGVPIANFTSGTGKPALLEAYETAQTRSVPLVICATYHSSEKLKFLPHIDVLIADEAHNMVSLEFSHGHTLASRRYYFTATPKNTKGVLGMQNKEIFGPQNSLSAALAVSRKLIVRPRIHHVKTSVLVDSCTEGAADARAIIESFEEHCKLLRVGGKMLVACRGSSDMKKLLKASNYMADLRRVRPNLTVFSILSDGEEGARINGVTVQRSDFMKRLKSLKDGDQAILLHYDILSEGIDISGITGVMPLRLLSTGKFLQMLGRACRLHSADRASDASPVGDRWDENFVKPYAWLILPTYGRNGEEHASSSEHYIECLRDYDFIPGQDEWFSEAGGDSIPADVDSLFIPGERTADLDFDGRIEQRIEDRLMAETYRELNLEDCMN